MPKVLCDPDPAAQRQMLEWMAAMIPSVPIEYYTNPLCFGLVNETDLLGVVTFHDYRVDPSTGAALMIEMSGAGRDEHWLSRRSLQFLFGYVFNQLGCRRLTTVTPRSSERVLNVDKKLGFTIEGCLRQALPNGDDLIIMGMLKDECRWIKQGAEDGEKRRRRGNARAS